MEERVIKIVVDKSQASSQIQSVKKEIGETNEVTKGLTNERVPQVEPVRYWCHEVRQYFTALLPGGSS